MGKQSNAGGVYPYYGELEKENKLYNRHRVFGMNTAKRGARVGPTDYL